MPRQLAILKWIFWVLGLAICVLGAWLSITYAEQMGHSGSDLATFINLIRLLARMLIMAYGLLMITTAVAISSRRLWVIRLTVTTASIALATIVFLPLGWYALAVLKQPEVRQHFGLVKR